MWSVWCRVCRLHQPAFTPTYWRTPLFSNRQALKERPRSGNHRRPYQQLFRFKEVQRKTGMSDLWNVIHKEEKAMLEHTIGLHTCKTIYLNLSLVTCMFYVLSPCTVYIMLSILFRLFLLENDDMESSKRCVKLLSLIFIIRCLTKSNLIGILERRSLKNIRASTGFKPVTSAIPVAVRCSTNWAMKPHIGSEVSCLNWSFQL